MKVKRILITNFHSTNMGDAAILHAMLAQLRPAFPDARISVHCSDSAIARKVLPFEGVEFRESIWPTFDHSAKLPGAMDFLNMAALLFGNFLSAALYRIFRAEIYTLNRPVRGSMDDFFHADFVLSIGGGFISDDYGYFRPYSDFIVAKILGKRLALYGQSIGPFGGAISRIVSRLVLGSADVILLRESRSERNLREIGITKTHVTADLAFALPRGPKKPPKNKKTVICVRPWTYRNREHADNYISFVRKLAGALADSGHSVTFVPTTPDDIRFYANLRPHLEGKATFISELHDPASIASTLAEADFIISSRMHPIVLGSLSSTPFFAIGWEYKLDELSRMLCGRDCSVHASRLDDSTIAAIFKMMGEKEELRREISKRAPGLRRKAMKNLDILKENVAQWGFSP
jgi:colanic acid/amylovoran biosynthesis protein